MDSEAEGQGICGFIIGFIGFWGFGGLRFGFSQKCLCGFRASGGCRGLGFGVWGSGSSSGSIIIYPRGRSEVMKAFRVFVRVRFGFC